MHDVHGCNSKQRGQAIQRMSACSAFSIRVDEASHQAVGCPAGRVGHQSGGSAGISIPAGIATSSNRYLQQFFNVSCYVESNSKEAKSLVVKFSAKVAETVGFVRTVTVSGEALNKQIWQDAMRNPRFLKLCIQLGPRGSPGAFENVISPPQVLDKHTPNKKTDVRPPTAPQVPLAKDSNKPITVMQVKTQPSQKQSSNQDKKRKAAAHAVDQPSKKTKIAKDANQLASSYLSYTSKKAFKTAFSSTTYPDRLYLRPGRLVSAGTEAKSKKTNVLQTPSLRDLDSWSRHEASKRQDVNQQTLKRPAKRPSPDSREATEDATCCGRHLPQSWISDKSVREIAKEDLTPNDECSECITEMYSLIQ